MDWSIIEPIAKAFHDHSYGAVALGVLLAVANLAFRIKTPAEWVAALDSLPRVHAFMSLVRALGIQPVEVVNALSRLVTGAPPPPAAEVKDGRLVVEVPSKSVPKDGPPVVGMLLLVGALGLMGTQTGCTWLQGKEGQLAVDGLKLAACVDAELLAGDTDPGTIASHCGMQLVPDVLALIGDRKAQMVATKSAGYSEGVKASVGVCHEGK